MAETCCEQQRWRGVCNCYGITASYAGTIVETIAKELEVQGCRCLTCRTRDAHRIIALVRATPQPTQGERT